MELINRLLKIQSDRNATQQTMDDVVKLMHEIFPMHDEFTSFRQCKDLVNKHCLTDCKRYHACPNDCVLFYDSETDPEYQYADLEQCPKCQAERYKEELGGGERKSRVPEKTFFYIPLRDLLDCFFADKDMVESLVRTKDGGLPHGGDPDARCEVSLTQAQAQAKTHAYEQAQTQFTHIGYNPVTRMGGERS
jgi:hypothetical protein